MQTRATEKQKIVLSKKLVLQAQEAEKNAAILRAQAKAALTRGGGQRQMHKRLQGWCA